MTSRRRTINRVNRQMAGSTRHKGYPKPGVGPSVFKWGLRGLLSFLASLGVAWLVEPLIGGYAVLVAAMVWCVMGAIWLR